MLHTRKILWLLLFASGLPLAATKTANLTVSATINSGCVFGSGSAPGNSNAGTLNFGTLGDVRNAVDVISSVGAGSLVVTCTPGIPVTIALDYGLNGGSASTRYMKLTTGTTTLSYQLYQDSNRTQVWGTGPLAMTISSFASTTQTWPIYGRLNAAAGMPPAGTYSDTVTVTVTY